MSARPSPCQELRRWLKKEMPHLDLKGLDEPQGCTIDAHDYELARTLEAKGAIGAFASIHVKGKDVDESDISYSFVPGPGRKTRSTFYDPHHMSRCRIYEVHSYGGVYSSIHFHVECKGMDDPQSIYALVDIVKRVNSTNREDAGLPRIGGGHRRG